MNESDVRRMIDEYWSALNARDMARLADFFTDDVVVEWPQSGERMRGRDACVNVYMNYPGGGPKLVEVPRVMGRDDFWVAELVTDYPDGKRFHTATVIELRDGKIAHQVDYFGEAFPAPAWRGQWTE
jgi:ketosteroid isomerase-like protein